MRSISSYRRLFVAHRRSTAGFAQESIKVAVLKQPPPQSIAAPVRDNLNGQGYRIQDEQGTIRRRYLAAKGDPESPRNRGNPRGRFFFRFWPRESLSGFCNSRPRDTTTVISPSPRAFTRCVTACSRSTAITWA